MNAHLLRAMLRRAGTMTLLVYATRTTAALLLGAPLGADFAGALASNLYRARIGAGDGALLLELGARRLPDMLGWSAGCALAYTALAPLLSIAWTSSMNDSSSVRASLRRGLLRYPAALGLGACAWLGCAALVAGAGAALALTLAHATLSPVAEDAARVACALAAAGALLVVSCVHDLGNGTLAVTTLSGRRALGVALRALSARALTARALSAVAIAGCFACAEAVGRSATLGPTAVLALQQALVFAATLLRGAWLALALQVLEARTAREGNSAPPRSAGAVPL